MSFEPAVIIPVALPALLYLWGSHQAPRSTTLRLRICFWLGWLFLAGALISPLHEMGESLFSAHMVQHEILMLLAAPLLVMSRPLAVFLHALPFGWRRTAGYWSKTPAVKTSWRMLTRPFPAWLLHAAALWVWHYPRFFDATLSNDWIHALQHLSFFLSALLFWWSLFHGAGKNAHGMAVLYVFTTGIHTGILGALLTLSGHPWYPVYQHTTAAWGLTPLEDQQLGGVVMWVPASLVYLATGLALFGAWLRNSAPAAPKSVLSHSALLSVIIGVITLWSCQSSRDQKAAAITGGDPHAGKAAITRYGCGSCHTIPQVSGAHGQVGPALTGISARRYIADHLDNTPDNMVRWITHPLQVNEKTAMPELGVTAADARNISAFLFSLPNK